MSYLTKYEMTDITPEPDEKTLSEMVRSLEYLIQNPEATEINMEEASKLFPHYQDDMVDFCSPFMDSMKWYEYEKDMKILSKQYPDYLFELYGEGEEPRDLWYHYFQNGKSQPAPARIEFDDYDEEKMV